MNDSNAIKDIEKGVKNILYKIPAATCNKVQCYFRVDLDQLLMYVANSIMASTKKNLMLGRNRWNHIKRSPKSRVGRERVIKKKKKNKCYEQKSVADMANITNYINKHSKYEWSKYIN